MKAKIVAIGLTVIACFSSISCQEDKKWESALEISKNSPLNVTLHGQKLEIYVVNIDGREYLAVHQGAGIWSFCPKTK